MSKQVEGRCPKCNCDLDDELVKKFYSGPRTFFEMECPNCLAQLDVEAVLSPVFMVSLVTLPSYDEQVDAMHEMDAQNAISNTQQ